MSSSLILSDLDLASLLASRVCHDVIGPVGAIVNGLEVLEEEDTDEEMREIAMTLVRKSAASASAKLKFSRLAFGASGSAGSEIDLSEAETILREFSDSPRVSLEWECPLQTRPKDQVKLLMNMVLIGLASIPRGGVLKISATEDRNDPTYEILCTGRRAKFPEKTDSLLNAEVDITEIDARDVQVYYTGLIARTSAMAVTTQVESEDVVKMSAKLILAPVSEAVSPFEPVEREQPLENPPLRQQ